MADPIRILALGGDGIGPEVVAAGLAVLDATGLTLEFEEGLLHGAARDAYGTFCRDETVASARAADAVLVGAVGGPKMGRHHRPRRARDAGRGHRRGAGAAALGLPARDAGAGATGSRHLRGRPRHRPPDIAGQGIANPMGTILSVAMLCEYSLARPDLARRIKAAATAALEAGHRTPDLGGTATTAACTDAVIAALRTL